MTSSRYEAGLARLSEIDGAAGENVIKALADIAPDLGRYVIEFGFGDIYSRPGLSLKSRELATSRRLPRLATRSRSWRCICTRR